MTALIADLWRAIKAGTWAPTAATIVTAAVSFGLLTPEVANVASHAVTTTAAAGSAIATAVSAIITVVHAIRGVKLVRDAQTSKEA